MKYIVEDSLREFPFWGPAEDTVKYLTEEELDTLEDYFSDDVLHLSNLMTKTDINDIFAYDEDYVAEFLGYNSFDEIMEERKDNA